MNGFGPKVQTCQAKALFGNLGKATQLARTVHIAFPVKETGENNFFYTAIGILFTVEKLLLLIMPVTTNLRTQLSSLVAVFSFKTKITNRNLEGGKFKHSPAGELEMKKDLSTVFKDAMRMPSMRAAK